MTQNFSLLIKPASYNCNLRCTYCFYWCKSKLFGMGTRRMSEEVLQQMIKSFYRADLDDYIFAWQGGEPTLMGLDFFRHAVDLQTQFLPEGKGFHNSLQTNGTMLDNKWAHFLKKHQFLVGISVDGPKALHNKYRYNAKHHGSYDDVMRGLNFLRKNKTEFNILTLVSESNVKHPQEVYRHSIEHGGLFQQYIECLEFGEGDDYKYFSLKPGQFGEFMCQIFDLWFPNDMFKVSIRLFDSIISRLMTGRPTMCTMGGDCRNYLVVEYDGSIYPCDFYVRKDLQLGNVADTDLADAAVSSCYEHFGRCKEPLSPECHDCRFLALCMGDCQKHRRGKTKSRLCEDWKMFYEHTIDRFEMIVEKLKSMPEYNPNLR